MTWNRVILMIAVSLALGGCATKGLTSIAGSECKIFEPPEYVVLGKRKYDQDYIDGNIEAGVGGCGWRRPAARPASLDTAPGQAIARPLPAKKQSLYRRIKDRVIKPKPTQAWPTATAPVLPTPQAAPMTQAAVAPAPPPDPPRDPVDELLDPTNTSTFMRRSK